MAKTSPRKPTRGRRTVREELSNPALAVDDSINGEESMSEFHDNEPEAPPTPKASAVKRLSLPLTEDESAVDWERVRNADKARRQLGISEAASTITEADGLFGADMIGLALDILSTSFVSVFKASGYTTDSAEATRLTEEQKGILIKRYDKILAKHAPTLGKWEDEIMAGVTTLMIFGGNFMNLKKAATVTQFPRAVPHQPDPAPTTPIVE